MSNIARSMAKLASDPAHFKFVMLGDSTSLFTMMTGLRDRLRIYHTAAGRVLYGVDPANIIDGGSNGASLAYWITGAACEYPLAQLWIDAPDLVVLCFGKNDVREGSRNQADLTADLTTAVGMIHTNLPAADIILRVPSFFLTTDDGAHGVVPNGSAQAYTTAMQSAYRSLTGTWPSVVVFDTPLGSVCQASSSTMADQMHPSTAGQYAIADHLAKLFEWTIRPPNTGLVGL